MNEPATGDNIGTKLTQPRLWIVRDHTYRYWGVFPSTGAATDWAKNKWPDINQYDVDNPEGWDIELLWQP